MSAFRGTEEPLREAIRRAEDAVAELTERNADLAREEMLRRRPDYRPALVLVGLILVGASSGYALRLATHSRVVTVVAPGRQDKRDVEDRLLRCKRDGFGFAEERARCEEKLEASRGVGGEHETKGFAIEARWCANPKTEIELRVERVYGDDGHLLRVKVPAHPALTLAERSCLIDTFERRPGSLPPLAPDEPHSVFNVIHLGGAP